jgi:hypothetical protein
MITTNKFGCIDITDDWVKWQQWLSSAKSFRYIPKSRGKAYTIRFEQGTKGKAAYWYAYRKETGKLAKCYAGINEGLTVDNLEALSSKLTEKLQSLVTEKLPAAPSALVTETPSVTNAEIEKLQIQIQELQRQLQIALGK